MDADAKLTAWRSEDHAQQLEAELALLRERRIEHFEAALSHERQLPEALERLADHHRAQVGFDADALAVRVCGAGGVQEQRHEREVQQKRESDMEIRAKIDQLLVKISKDGMSSLTQEERDYLTEHSQQYPKS